MTSWIGPAFGLCIAAGLMKECIDADCPAMPQLRSSNSRWRGAPYTSWFAKNVLSLDCAAATVHSSAPNVDSDSPLARSVRAKLQLRRDPDVNVHWARLLRRNLAQA